MNQEVCQHGAPLAQRCERCGRSGFDSLSAAWEDGRRFGMQQWWPADQEPETAGLFVVRDDAGNTEVATWLCDWSGRNGEWTRELRDVNRERIVAWIRLPEWPT